MTTKDNNFRIFTLHSQKGGGGKTSLAITIAALESTYRGSPTLLIDADLTGTCLWDALGKEQRKQSNYIYLNDVLEANPDENLGLLDVNKRGYVPAECKKKWKEKIIFSHPVVQDVSYFSAIQSNPRLDVVREILPSLAQESFFSLYAEKLTEIVAHGYGLGYRTLVIDLPPGLCGLSEAALSLLEYNNLFGELHRYGFDKSKEKLCFCPIVVTTNDRADYLGVFPGAWSLMNIVRKERDESEEKERNESEEVEFNVWVNKIEPRSKKIGASIDPAFDLAEMFEMLWNIESYRNRFSEEDSIKIGDPKISRNKSGKCSKGTYCEFLRKKEKEAIKTGGPAFPYVPFFSMSDICLVISNIYNNQKPKEKIALGMEQWVKDIAKALGIELKGRAGSSKNA